MRGLIPVLLLVLAACQPDGTKPLAPVGAALVTADRASCEKRGGIFGALGASGALTCFTTPRDAGKSCSKATDCESACLARSMTCAPITPLNGCNEIINSAGARLTQCIE